MSFPKSSKRTPALSAAHRSNSLDHDHPGVAHGVDVVRRGPARSPRPRPEAEGSLEPPCRMHKSASARTAGRPVSHRTLETQRTKPECYRNQESSESMSLPDGQEAASGTADGREARTASLLIDGADERSRNVAEKRMLTKICQESEARPSWVRAAVAGRQNSGAPFGR